MKYISGCEWMVSGHLKPLQVTTISQVLWSVPQLLLTTVWSQYGTLMVLAFYCQLGKGLSLDGSSWLYKILWKSPLSPEGVGMFTVMPMEMHSFLQDLLSKTLFNMKYKRRYCLIIPLHCSWLSCGLQDQHLKLLVTYSRCR